VSTTTPRKKDPESLWSDVSRHMISAIENFQPRVLSGQLLAVSGTIVKARLPGVEVGELCELRDGESAQPRLAEVIGIEGEVAYLAPYESSLGLSQRTEVIGLQRAATIFAGDHLLGCVVDGFGAIVEPSTRPADMPKLSESYERPFFAAPPPPMTRKPIHDPLALGVRSLDGLLTCGKGQRMGVFGNAGTGKSTLVSQIVQGTEADVIIIGLIGERGREVGDFLRETMRPELRTKAIIVASTSDRPPLERMKAAHLATALAEHYRDAGREVLLFVDSATRFARALREIGLSAGEIPARRGFPSSVFMQLPQLFERAGPGPVGAITALYTLLVEGSDLAADPISEEAKSLLDGHIVLSEKLAQSGHYPAIDVLASRSRIMNQIVSKEHKKSANTMRELLAKYKEVELLIQVGEYKPGNDLLADRAIALKPTIDAFLKQTSEEIPSFDEVLAAMDAALVQQ
jgi:ATP synthase in type III secretion protein N